MIKKCSPSLSLCFVSQSGSSVIIALGFRILLQMLTYNNLKDEQLNQYKSNKFMFELIHQSMALYYTEGTVGTTFYLSRENGEPHKNTIIKRERCICLVTKNNVNTV